MDAIIIKLDSIHIHTMQYNKQPEVFIPKKFKRVAVKPIF
uniref:Uncharacterized protein n=1 Tax=Rhizophora mucronata TaxID=61149 RepID=A0A2P2P2G1_RHIMU